MLAVPIRCGKDKLVVGLQRSRRCVSLADWLVTTHTHVARILVDVPSRPSAHPVRKAICFKRDAHIFTGDLHEPTERVLRDADREEGEVPAHGAKTGVHCGCRDICRGPLNVWPRMSKCKPRGASGLRRRIMSAMGQEARTLSCRNTELGEHDSVTLSKLGARKNASDIGRR
jgi:hypothetical protein